MSSNTCKHAACTCSVATDETFCSKACGESSDAKGEQRCCCEHLACLGAAGTKGERALRSGESLAD